MPWLTGAQCHNCRKKQSWGDSDYLNPPVCSITYTSTVNDLVTFLLTQTHTNIIFREFQKQSKHWSSYFLKTPIFPKEANISSVFPDKICVLQRYVPIPAPNTSVYHLILHSPTENKFAWRQHEKWSWNLGALWHIFTGWFHVYRSSFFLRCCYNYPLFLLLFSPGQIPVNLQLYIPLVTQKDVPRTSEM